MSDGVSITSGSGTTIATDDAGASGHVQIVKLAIATDGSATLIPAIAADGLLVNLGTNNDVTVTTTALPTPAATGTVTSVSDSATSATLLSSSASRKGFRLYNDSEYAAYVKYGTTASTTDFTVYLLPGGYLEEGSYYGRVDCIWAANGSGSMRITDLS